MELTGTVNEVEAFDTPNQVNGRPGACVTLCCFSPGLSFPDHIRARHGPMAEHARQAGRGSARPQDHTARPGSPRVSGHWALIDICHQTDTTLSLKLQRDKMKQYQKRVSTPTGSG